MDVAFSGEIWFWRGPSPYHFVTVPAAQCRDLASTASLVSYGWGMIPVTARVGRTTWTTSLFPKNGGAPPAGARTGARRGGGAGGGAPPPPPPPPPGRRTRPPGAP